MSLDIGKKVSPTRFQNALGRAVYEQAMTGAFVPDWSSLREVKRWRWIWAGEAAVALARATSALPVPEPAVVVSAPAPLISQPRREATAPLDIHENWGQSIRQRRREQRAVRPMDRLLAQPIRCRDGRTS